MLSHEFEQVCSGADKEAVCQAVFDEAYRTWRAAGRGALSEGQLAVLCVESFFREATIGGIDQYLCSEAGRLARFAPHALQRVGLAEYAAVLDEALKCCTNAPQENDEGELEDFFEPIETQAPEHQEDEEIEPFEDLDHRFFDMYLGNRTEFRERLCQYIVDHESEFVSRLEP